MKYEYKWGLVHGLSQIKQKSFNENIVYIEKALKETKRLFLLQMGD